MSKEIELNNTPLSEDLKTPDPASVLGWQRNAVGAVIRTDQLKKWQTDPWQMDENAKSINDSDRELMQILGPGAWNINKVTPGLNGRYPLIGLGGWCTWSEGDTASIYAGRLPNGQEVKSPDDLISFLYQSGNRWEQVIRCIGPLGFRQNGIVASEIPYFIVVEDSLWASRIAERLEKPEWQQALEQGFKEHAKRTSEGLIRKWLSFVSGYKRNGIYFFYTSDVPDLIDTALDQFADSLQYPEAKNLVKNMPVLLMYTGYWLDLIKQVYRLRNSSSYSSTIVTKDTRAIISEVDTHFKLRGEEERFVGGFFWRNKPGERRNENPNKDIYLAGFYQQKVATANKKMVPTYALKYDETLNFGNRTTFIKKMLDAVTNADRVYPFMHPVCLEVLSSLYWLPEARFLINKLLLLPKEGMQVKQNSQKAVDTFYKADAKKILYCLIDYLNDLYESIGYK